MKATERNNLSAPPFKIRIVSFSDGEKSVYECDGKVVFDGDETEFEYMQDSSVVILKAAKDGSVLMRRTGDCFLEMLFLKDRLTHVSIGLGGENESGARGTVPLFTEDIRYTSAADGTSVSLYLKYEIRYEGGEQKFAVRVLATAKGICKESEK